MRILGIDAGTKRIGLAVSDPLGITAQALDTMPVNKADLISHVKKIIKDYDISEIVVGLPLNMDGTEGNQAKACAQLAERLRNEVNLPVKLWDERLSSRAAERAMLEADVSRQKRKHASDKLSAQIILQGYLDAVQKKVA